MARADRRADEPRQCRSGAHHHSRCVAAGRRGAMSESRRPPRLLVKAVVVTFGPVAALLLLVFFFVRMTVRDQVRLTVTQNLDLSQRMLAVLEDRRLHELRTQALTLAENPTLKAAMDTYAAEVSYGSNYARDQLLAT